MIFGAEHILKQVRRITEIRTVKGNGQVWMRKFESPLSGTYILRALSTWFQLLHHCKFLCQKSRIYFVPIEDSSI
jgi:hypothetical protein